MLNNKKENVYQENHSTEHWETDYNPEFLQKRIFKLLKYKM